MTVQQLNTLLGKNIRHYRKKKGMTQTRLANEVGISTGTLSDFERGIHLAGGKSLVLISYALGVEVWRLFFDEKRELK